MAVIEGAASKSERNAVNEHLSECAVCAELRSRLLNFESLSPPEPEAEWNQTETRLDKWLEGFLRSEAAHGRSPEGGKSSKRGFSWESILNLFTPRKIIWASCGALALVLIVGAPLLLKYGRGLHPPAQVAVRAPLPPVTPNPTPRGNPPASSEKPKETPSGAALPKAANNLPANPEAPNAPRAGELSAPVAPALTPAPANNNPPRQMAQVAPPPAPNAALPSAQPEHSPPNAIEQATVPPPQNPTSTPQRKRVVADLSGFDLLESSKVRRQTTVLVATRGLPRPVALAPRLGKLFGTTPEFAWSYAGESRGFVFVVRDAAQQEVFRVPVTGNTFRYPKDAPALKPERTYFWTVELPSAFFGPTSSAPAGLLVVSPSQREEIEERLAQLTGDSYDASLSRARVFTDYRLWYDALDAYTDLITRYPDHSELYEQRAAIYAQLDVTQELAAQDFKLADGLRVRK